jgi:3-oxoacyl-[acyl-carrier protein] reductase
LAEGGARLALVDILPPTSVEEEIRQQGGEALAVQMDITDEEQIKAGFARILKHFGKVDILINNAGITRDQLALRMKRADWDDVIATNLTGAYLCIQQVLGHMLRQRSGRIINVASVVAQMGNPGQANYVASKAGLIGLTKALAMELASRSVTVNAVAPGFIVSPMTDPLPDKVKQALLDRIPLGRMGTDGEVATGICFLASDEAGYITGHVLNINGGLYLA